MLPKLVSSSFIFLTRAALIIINIIHMYIILAIIILIIIHPPHHHHPHFFFFFFPVIHAPSMGPSPRDEALAARLELEPSRQQDEKRAERSGCQRRRSKYALTSKAATHPGIRQHFQTEA